MLNPKVYSVSKINGYIQTLLVNDVVLKNLWIAGEVSNFKLHSSGHMYFSLKDSDSVMKCVMYKGYAKMLPFVPQNGMSVIIYGHISLYEKSGEYQLVAELIEPDGVGALTMAFEQLKEKLRLEGMFDSDYKRDINKRPKNIAVVTSPTGAAVRDIIKVISNRNKNVDITVIPVLVQGAAAADSIVEGIRFVNKFGKADTIIVGRGGGSIEDLWAFNNEKVARAIFASEIPIISAVGHEIDFTIADFVADVRASTPSNAAEIAVMDINEDKRRAYELFDRLDRALKNVIEDKQDYFWGIIESNVFVNPEKNILDKYEYVKSLNISVMKNSQNIMEKNSSRLVKAASNLEALSPVKVLLRGYSYTSDEKGNIVTSAKEVSIDDSISVTLADGFLTTTVKDKVVFDGKEKN